MPRPKRSASVKSSKSECTGKCGEFSGCFRCEEQFERSSAKRAKLKSERNVDTCDGSCGRCRRCKKKVLNRLYYQKNKERLKDARDEARNNPESPEDHSADVFEVKDDVNVLDSVFPDKRTADELSEILRKSCNAFHESNFVSVICSECKRLVSKTYFSRDCKICTTCNVSLDQGKVPKFSSRNGLAFGDIPPELQGLSLLEEILIARNRLRCIIVKLAFGNVKSGDLLQRALRGHVIAFPQDTSEIYAALQLPSSLHEVLESVKVILTGTIATAAAKKSILASYGRVRRDRVRDAIRWKKHNDPFYNDVQLSEDNLSLLPDDDVPHVFLDDISELSPADGSPEEKVDADADVVQNESVGFIDFSGLTIPTGHLQNIGFQNAILNVSHGSSPVTEYDDCYWSHTFPVLFPYGKGLPKSPRDTPVSFIKWLQYCLQLGDRRFATHPTFIFVAYNVLQRRKVCENVRLRCSSESSVRIARLIRQLQSQDIVDLRRLAASKTVDWSSNLSSEIRNLLRDVQIAGAPLLGSVHSKIHRRNEIRGIIAKFGLPLIWLTLNPAEAFNPIVPLMAGVSETLAHMMNASERLKLVSQDPVAVAKYFDAFVNNVFKYVISQGIFGNYIGHFGSVETQGRGGLHLHCLIWIKGVPPPEVLHNKLATDSDFMNSVLEFRDSIINECDVELTEEEVQKLAEEVDSMRSPKPVSVDSEHFVKMAAFLARRLNMHKKTHTPSCTKFGTSECRFGFPRELIPNTYYDALHKIVRSKRNSSWLNAFNLLLMYLLRCNHDIQLLNTANDCLALVYYITDYATKHHLKAHDLLTLISSAFMRIRSSLNPESAEMNDLLLGQSTLMKCINTIGTTQEISGPLCALHILFEKESYTNFAFINLNWMSILIWYEHHLAGQEITDDVVFAGAQLKSNMRQDYMYRGCENRLEEMNLYTYVSTVYKQSGSNHTASGPKNVSRFEFAHPLHETHEQRVRLNGDLCVVLIGKNLPDINYNSEEFYKMTLLLFKPWSVHQQLKHETQTWQEAYDEFFSTATQVTGNPFWSRYSIPSVSQLRDNLKLLRRCKEAAELSRAQFSEVIPTPSINPEAERIDAEFTDYNDEDANERTLQSTMDEDGTMLLAEMMEVSSTSTAGLMQEVFTMNAFDRVSLLYDASNFSVVTENFQTTVDNLNESNLQTQWKTIQKKISTATDPSDAESQLMCIQADQRIRVLREYNLADDVARVLEPQIILRKVVNKRKLNVDQARAVAMVCGHELTESTEQLFLYVGGAAGTGKSEVIKAISDYFALRGLSSQIKLSATTGTAACKLNGSTIHSLCKLSKSSKPEVDAAKQRLSKKNNALRAEWHMVRYLIVDESSMLNGELLHNINYTLQVAKECPNKPFGGVNVILAGDFFQFPPVIGAPLYSEIPAVEPTTNYQQAEYLGLILWKQLDKVILLTENFRQKTDPVYLGIVERFLAGKSTEDDIAMIKSRIIRRGLTPPRDTQMIVNRNSIRSVLNGHFINGICSSAIQRNSIVIEAKDSCNNAAIGIQLPGVREKLLTLDDSKTDGLPGKLKIFIGMKCMVTTNVATTSGLSNGSLCTVWYFPEPTAENLMPDYILLKLDIPCDTNYPGLPDNVVPLFPLRGSFQITLKNKQKSTISISRFQFPLVPAYAITDYKSQGGSLKNTLLDLRKPPTGKWAVFFAVYVLLSRVTTLDGLYIMCDFDESIFQTKPPEQIVALMTELKRLHANTVAFHDERYSDIIN